MKKDWTSLVRLTGGQPLTVERVRLDDDDVRLEGGWQLPPLAQLSPDDQVFVAVFVKCHGSIKRMEQYFGVSYPTVKSRLNRIGGLLDFVDVENEEDTSDTLTRLERGEITVSEAVALLRKGEKDE